MSKIFDQVNYKRPKSNVFDLSHERKMTMDMGKLVPMYLQEIVPGDKFRISSEMLVRFSPLLAPVMHRINVYTHFFFVPNRLLWNSWEDFITGGEDGLQAPQFPLLSMNSGNQQYFEKGTLSDYLGLPVMTGSPGIFPQVSALPFRAYTAIYNEYYRDQNLITKIDFDKSSTAQDYSKICILRQRAWEKDYFTSALPWPQRGAEVILPNTGTVVYKDVLDTTQLPISPNGPTATLYNNSGKMAIAGGGDAVLENIESVETEITINNLRRATRLQEWLEKNARAGSRYIEQILSHFGVRSSDARLQRPEYLGGGKIPVTVSEVLSTFNTVDQTIPGGQMYGHGLGVGNTNRVSRSFEEHGWIIGIVSIMPKSAYQQGIERHWYKKDKFDYYWPEFAHLGEQEVWHDELYCDFQATLGSLFGYQSRYAEYKYKQSSVHGDFKDNLSYWHLGRIFGAKPVLNQSFIETDSATLNRIFAVEDETENKIYLQIYNNVRAIRPMPVFGTPSL